MLYIQQTHKSSLQSCEAGTVTHPSPGRSVAFKMLKTGLERFQTHYDKLLSGIVKCCWPLFCSSKNKGTPVPIPSSPSPPNPVFLWSHRAHERPQRNDLQVIFGIPQLVAQTVKNPPAKQEILVWFLGWEDALEGWQPTPVFSPEESHRQSGERRLQWVRHDWATNHSTVSRFGTHKQHFQTFFCLESKGNSRTKVLSLNIFKLTSSGGSDSKESACNSGDLSLIPGVGRSPGEGNGYLLQYSCLENSMDRRARL